MQVRYKDFYGDTRNYWQGWFGKDAWLVFPENMVIGVLLTSLYHVCPSKRCQNKWLVSPIRLWSKDCLYLIHSFCMYDACNACDLSKAIIQKWCSLAKLWFGWVFFVFFLIGIQSLQGWTATLKHGVIKTRSTKRLKAYRKSV